MQFTASKLETQNENATRGLLSVSTCVKKVLFKGVPHASNRRMIFKQVIAFPQCCHTNHLLPLNVPEVIR